MIKLENFKEHLDTISRQDWLKLLGLIDDIDKIDMSAKTDGSEKNDIIYLTNLSETEIASKFITISYELKLIPIFDWMEWEEGKNTLQNSLLENFEKYDIVALCKFIGTIIRLDRFNEGYLIYHLKNKTISKILNSLKNKILNEDK